MIAVIHVLTGAAIGVSLQTAPAIVIAAFFSHYLLDLLPHIDAETFASRKLPYSWTQFSSLLIDSFTALAVTTLLFFFHERWNLVILGTLVSLLPDLLIPLERYGQFQPLRQFHELFHWNVRHAQYLPGYLAGLVTPAMIAVVSSVILWTSF